MRQTPVTEAAHPGEGLRMSRSELSLAFSARRRGRGKRRVALVTLVELALTIGAPTGAVAPNGEFPMGWLWSWLSQRPAWSAFNGFETLPQQGNALGRDDPHYVPASETRATTGTGRDAGRAPGALDAATPLTSPARSPWTTSTLPNFGSFDPKTCRKLSGRSNAGADTYQNADGSFTRTVSSGTTNFRGHGWLVEAD
jgi:hypothetical protein